MSNWCIKLQYRGFILLLQSYGPHGEPNTLTWVTGDSTGPKFFGRSWDALKWIDVQVESDPHD